MSEEPSIRELRIAIANLQAEVSAYGILFAAIMNRIGPLLGDEFPAELFDEAVHTLQFRAAHAASESDRLHLHTAAECLENLRLIVKPRKK